MDVEIQTDNKVDSLATKVVDTGRMQGYTYFQIAVTCHEYVRHLEKLKQITPEEEEIRNYLIDIGRLKPIN